MESKGVTGQRLEGIWCLGSEPALQGIGIYVEAEESWIEGMMRWGRLRKLPNPIWLTGSSLGFSHTPIHNSWACPKASQKSSQRGNTEWTWLGITWNPGVSSKPTNPLAAFWCSLLCFKDNCKAPFLWEHLSMNNHKTAPMGALSRGWVLGWLTVCSVLAQCYLQNWSAKSWISVTGRAKNLEAGGLFFTFQDVEKKNLWKKEVLQFFCHPSA